jgi:hypothetical protein
MFIINKVAHNRIDIELSGRLNSDDMKLALDNLISQSKSIEHGRMLYRINDFDFPTLGAIGVELSRLPALFGLIHRFDRAAVLSDKKWIQRLSEFEGFVFPGLEIKAFDCNDVLAAEAWLAGSPE